MPERWAEPADSVAGVVEALDAVISRARAEESPLG